MFKISFTFTLQAANVAEQYLRSDLFFLVFVFRFYVFFFFLFLNGDGVKCLWRVWGVLGRLVGEDLE
jgi:hypothetical protein